MPELKENVQLLPEHPIEPLTTAQNLNRRRSGCHPSKIHFAKAAGADDGGEMISKSLDLSPPELPSTEKNMVKNGFFMSKFGFLEESKQTHLEKLKNKENPGRKKRNEERLRSEVKKKNI